MKTNKYWILIISLLFMVGCSKSDKTADKVSSNVVEDKVLDPMKNIGIGPISSVELSSNINQVLAASGKEIYECPL